jgi:hypothetical protein
MTGDLDILSASQYPHGLMQPYEEEDPNPRKRKAAMGLDHFQSQQRRRSLFLCRARDVWLFQEAENGQTSDD